VHDLGQREQLRAKHQAGSIRRVRVDRKAHAVVLKGKLDRPARGCKAVCLANG